MRVLRMLIELVLGVALIGIIIWFVVTQPLFSTPPCQTPAEVSTANLKQHVKTLSHDLPPRTTPANLDIAAQYIRNQLAPFGTVTEQTYQVDNETYRNLSLTLGPKTDKRLVIGAHYDAHDWQPGADDNASAVAGLIELARLLSTQPLTKTVELVAYTLEEPPFFGTNDMGSARHADELKANNVDIELMISLEMIGYFSDEPNSQDYPLGFMKYWYSDKGNFIAIVSNLSGMGIVRTSKAAMRSVMNVPVYSINAPSLVPGIDFSDHRNYWDNDYPAIMITDTAFYRNKAYHTIKDTWERLDYNKMAEVVAGTFAIVKERAVVSK